MRLPGRGAYTAAKLGRAEAARQTRTEARADANGVGRFVMRAEDQLERSGATREEGVAIRHDRGAEQLGTDHEVARVVAIADGSRHHGLRAFGGAVEAGVVAAIEHAELGGVGKVANITGEQQTR